MIGSLKDSITDLYPIIAIQQVIIGLFILIPWLSFDILCWKDDVSNIV